MAPLEALGLASLTPDVLHFLASNQIFTVEDFMTQDLVHSEDAQIQEVLSELFGYLEKCHRPWESGVDILDKFLKAEYLSTGFQSLDILLRGGLRDGTITEVVGASSSGKTQICLHAAASVAYKHKHAVVYIDTSASFSPERIFHIITGTNACTENVQDDVKEALQRIFCYRAYDVHRLLDILHSIYGKMRSHQESMRLVIVDSPASVLSPIMGDSTVQGHALMISVSQVLKKIAIDNNIPVLITNNTVATEDEELKPALGESWKVVPHVRLFLDKNHENNSCTATLVKHTSMACSTQASFSFDRG